MLNVTWYEYGDHQHNFQKYGYEYLNDDESGYLRWFVGDNPTLQSILKLYIQMVMLVGESYLKRTFKFDFKFWYI